MVTEPFMRALIQWVDTCDTDGFRDAFTSAGVFRFGNVPVTTGPEAIGAQVKPLFAAVASISHRVEDIWVTPSATICHGQVCFTRLDKSTLCVPFAAIAKGEDAAIADFRFFMDCSGLFHLTAGVSA